MVSGQALIDLSFGFSLKVQSIKFQLVDKVILLYIPGQFVEYGLNFYRCFFEVFCHFGKHYVADMLDCVAILNSFELEEIDHGYGRFDLIFVWIGRHEQVFDLLDFFIGESLQDAPDLKKCGLFDFLKGLFKRVSYLIDGLDRIKCTS